MNLKATLVIAVILLSPGLAGGAKAMTIDDFARLNDDDAAEFITVLVGASAQMLKSHGQPDQADKVIALFHDPGVNGGVHQLASNIKMYYRLNMRNAINPNNRASVYQVEDAMSRTLKDAGFVVPVSYLLAASKDFQAVGPPRR